MNPETETDVIAERLQLHSSFKENFVFCLVFLDLEK